MTKEDYIKTDAISYSTLRKIATDPKEVIEKKDIKDFPSVKRGDLLDILMEDPELFHKKYVYFDGEIPTNTLLSLADSTIKYGYTVGKTAKEVSNEDVLDIIKEKKYWASTKKEDLLLKKFNNDLFWNYVDFKLKNDDKLIIDKNIYNQVEEAKKTFLTHIWTREIFERDLIYQQYIVVKIPHKGKTIKVKIAPDLLSIDHENKIIYSFDFKFLSGTSAKTFKSKNFIPKFLYLQSTLYSIALKIWAKEHYPDYRVPTYNFLVISDTNLSYPLIYDSFQYHQKGITGFDYYGRDYPGLTQLIEDYYWHRENDVWEHKRHLYDNNGVIMLN